MSRETLIVCAGMYRSGSTFQFNAVRLLMESVHGEENVYVCFGWDYNRKNKKPIHIVKIHQFEPMLSIDADLIFTAIRDKEGILGSMRRNRDFHLENESSHLLGNAQTTWAYDTNIKQFEKWKDRAVFTQEYDRIKTDLDDLLEDYASYLAVPFENISSVKKKLLEIKPPIDKDVDNRTLLFVGHVTSKP